MSELVVSSPGRSTQGRWGRVSSRLREIRALRPPLRSPRAYGNWLRANVELISRAGVIRARPLKLTFDPTNYCQLKCPLCPTGARIQDRGQGRAQRHLFEHLMEELGDYLFIIDFFNWGEPLLNDQVEDFIGMAHARGIVTFMSSNLSLPLSDARLERLARSGLNELIVSLDGASAETYGQYRRVGRFDLVVENIRRLVGIKRALGLSTPRINWQFLVFRFNEHERERAEVLARDLGVDSLTFRAPYLDEGRVPLAESDRALVREWAPLAEEFNRYQATGSEPPVPDRPRCGWHYMSTAVNWDGSVAPCCTLFESRDDFGSLSTPDGASYMQVVNNDRFVAVRERFAGRQPVDSGLVCEKCPTPSLMGYHRHLNKQVLLYLLAGSLNAMAGHAPAAADRQEW